MGPTKFSYLRDSINELDDFMISIRTKIRDAEFED